MEVATAGSASGLSDEQRDFVAALRDFCSREFGRDRLRSLTDDFSDIHNHDVARQMAGLPVPSPSMMDTQKQQMVQQLQSLSGGQFDRMYIQGQTTGHQELLQLHQAMAQSGATREERMLGTVAVPAIKSHLAMLQGIQQQMRG